MWVSAATRTKCDAAPVNNGLAARGMLRFHCTHKFTHTEHAARVVALHTVITINTIQSSRSQGTFSYSFIPFCCALLVNTVNTLATPTFPAHPRAVANQFATLMMSRMRAPHRCQRSRRRRRRRRHDIIHNAINGSDVTWNLLNEMFSMARAPLRTAQTRTTHTYKHTRG